MKARIQPSQIWADRGSRHLGRTVRVITTCSPWVNGYVHVEVVTDGPGLLRSAVGRKSLVRVSSFVSRYRLVSEGAGE